MQFGPVPVHQALGAILAHSVPLPHGRLRKGKVLDAADLADLGAAGLEMVTVARLDPADMAEDDAARGIAHALVGNAAGLELRAVGTGRVNIHARAAGLVQVHAAQVHALNAIDPAMTVATLPPLQRVSAGEMVATVKIIAYAVAQASVQRACDVGANALAHLPPLIDTATLIQTRVTLDDDGAKGHAVTAARLARLGASLASPVLVPHEIGALAQALEAAQGGLVLILTGSATSDLFDTAPQALRAAGGEVVHFGMPVDPGNLLFLGYLDKRPVIGLPGCAKSPALNGADWILERVICGVSVTAADIMGLGVGGLLKEIPTRPRPRAAR